MTRRLSPLAPSRQVIEEAVGCAALNRRVARLMHSALNHVALGLLDGLPSTERASSKLLVATAGYLQHHGNYEAAERLYREDLAAKRESEGASHVDTIAAQQSLAQLLAEGKGDLAEAETLSREALPATGRMPTRSNRCQ